MEVRRKYLESDLVILAVNVWEREQGEDRAKKVRDYVAREKLNFNVVLCKDETADAYGVRGIPSGFIIASDGRLALKAHPAEGRFASAIEKLVGRLREKKIGEIQAAIDAGTVDVRVAKGKGAYNSLSELPPGFTLAGTKNGRPDAAKLAQALRALLELGEKADATADAESYYVYVQAKGFMFMHTAPAASAPEAVKNLYALLGGT